MISYLLSKFRTFFIFTGSNMNSRGRPESGHLLSTSFAHQKHFIPLIFQGANIQYSNLVLSFIKNDNERNKLALRDIFPSYVCKPSITSFSPKAHIGFFYSSLISTKTAFLRNIRYICIEECFCRTNLYFRYYPLSTMLTSKFTWIFYRFKHCDHTSIMDKILDIRIVQFQGGRNNLEEEGYF